MAIYHCSLKVFSRSEGHSAVAAAAYRSGSILRCERSGRIHRYHKRTGVADTFILAPPSAPKTLLTRAVLWNTAEASETRKNSRVAREVILALPHELSDKARAELTRDMGLYLLERYRVAVDVAIHSPCVGDGHDPRNHHAHLLFTTREVTKDGLGAKTRILDDKITGPQEIEIIREVWETLANDALERAGFVDVKIDRRTLEAQGVDRIPQTHEGKASKNVEGYESFLVNDFKKAESGNDDGDGKEDSSGEKSSSSSSSSRGGGLHLKSKERQDNTGRKIDYLTIDQKQTRSMFNEEIKALNKVRAAFGDKPLLVQIAQLDRLMERLDKRLEKLQQIEAKISLSSVTKGAIRNAIKLASNFLNYRIEAKAQINLNIEEKQHRTARHLTRYGRDYRSGLHHKISEMKQNISILEQKQINFKNYKSFVDKIEEQMRQSPKAAFKRSDIHKSTNTVTTEFKTESKVLSHTKKIEILPIKNAFTVKAEEKSTPKDRTEYKQPMSVKIKALEQAILEQKTTKAKVVTGKLEGHKNWFIPATNKTRPMMEAIDKAIKQERENQPISARPTSINQEKFIKAQERPQKITTYSEVRKRVKEEAEIKRSKIPSEYRATPYEAKNKTLQADNEIAQKPISKAQGTFKQAAKSEDKPKPSSSKMSNTFNMKSGFNESSRNKQKLKKDIAPEAEI